LIVGGGAVLRASYNANTIVVDPVRADAAYYLIYAHNLVDYGIFSKGRSQPPVPDSYWAPGYPAFLAAVIGVSEALSIDTYNAIINTQLVLGVGTIFLCFLLARRFLPDYWSLLPPFFVAISPHLVSTASYILTETLFGFVLALSLYALIRAIGSGRSLGWLVAGLCFAVTYLVNPISVFLAPLLAVALLLRGRRKSGNTEHGRLALALLLAPVIIAVLGWSLRATISVPADQPNSADRLLNNLVVGLYPDYHDKWRASILQPDKNVVVPGAGVDESYATFFNVLGERLVDQPLETLAWYAFHKPVLLWDWDVKTGWGEIYIYRVEVSLYETSVPAISTFSLMWSLHFWLLGAGVLGAGYLLTKGRPNSPTPMILYITVVYISAIYVISQAEPRYSIPLRPEMYLCATFFLWRTWELVRRQKWHL
jgi:hypothetical protein